MDISESQRNAGGRTGDGVLVQVLRGPGCRDLPDRHRFDGGEGSRGGEAGSGISDGVVRIGVLGDYGSGKDLGGAGSVTAARLAADDFHNTVLGKPIEIVSADHQNKPDAAVGIAKKWFDLERVDAVTDLAVSSVGLAVAGLATQSNRTALVSGAATSELTGKSCSPVITHWADDTYALSAGLVGELGQRVGKDWYFVAVDYSFGTAMVRDASKAVVAAGGKVLGTVRYPFNTTDFSSFPAVGAKFGREGRRARQHRRRHRQRGQAGP